MPRLPLASADPNAERIAELKALFPEAFAEGKINFDRLRLALGDAVDTGRERYGLTWAGKADAIRAIQVPSAGTLTPDRDQSVNFDATENLIIEGDNLEALKLLQKSYYGKVKMIYIDPPYNTGNEFIYPDNFREGLQDYLRYSGQVKDDGTRVSSDEDKSGRFHSRWLSMMYPRLFLAKNLLREDGVIFVSIDDHEVHNLREIMDEIFGEECFKNEIIFKRGAKNVQAQFETVDCLTVGHEYVLMYAKNSSVRFPKLQVELDDAKPGGWNNHWRGTERASMRGTIFGITPESGQWRWGHDRNLVAITNYERMLADTGINADEITQEQIDEWYTQEVEKTGEELDLLRFSKYGKPEHYLPATERS